MSQTAHQTLEDFAAVIRDLTATAGRITEIEEAKAEAASEGRHRQLDGFIQEEQAHILKLRGLEQHRLKLAESLGWKSLTFRQILEKTSSDETELLSPLFSELERQLKRLEQAREAAEKIIKVRLHEIQTTIARQHGASYDNSGNLSSEALPHTKLQNKYV
ncbi:hypothetical protein D5274_01960 [bacterium 1XD42-94]|nr:hypothetical protein [bacterium 1XD42-76]NBK03960.1 hypothetical protein [bacterium 1XD42-94]